MLNLFYSFLLFFVVLVCVSNFYFQAFSYLWKLSTKISHDGDI